MGEINTCPVTSPGSILIGKILFFFQRSFLNVKSHVLPVFVRHSFSSTKICKFLCFLPYLKISRSSVGKWLGRSLVFMGVDGST